MYKRKIYDTIIKRLGEQRMFIQVIMGPRQIGKSTVIKQVLDDLSKPFLSILPTPYLQHLPLGLAIAGIMRVFKCAHKDLKK